MVRPIGEQTAGIEFEALRSYACCVALPRAHPFARLKSIPLEKVTGARLVLLGRQNYSEYHRILERIFAPVSSKPHIAMECDSENSLFMEVEAGRAIAAVTTITKLADRREPLTSRNARGHQFSQVEKAGLACERGSFAFPSTSVYFARGADVGEDAPRNF
jgi:DNA-binding transcriptional LysR family regulator